MSATEFPQRADLAGVELRVEISDAMLHALVQFAPDVGPAFSLDVELDELTAIIGVLAAARSELHAMKKGREDKQRAAEMFVMQCGGVDEARAALAQVPA